jgi:membrane protein
VKLPGFITRARDGITARWHAAAERHFWLKHLALAWDRYRDNNGNHYAAALTYFSFLALFPILLLSASVIGFILRNNTELQQELFDRIAANVPGGFGETIKDSINAAVRQRTSIGVFGLVGLLLTGQGWVGNLRAAINAVWGVEPPRKNVVLAQLSNLGVLVGLGIGILISIGLTTTGTRFADRTLRALGLADVPAAHTILTITGILLALAGDLVIFAWVLVRLPRTEPPPGVAFKGALFASVGFEILKVVGTYYISRVTRSPAVGAFGSIIGVLLWMDLVSRLVLYSAAWTATLIPSPAPAPSAAPAPDEQGEPGEPGGPGGPVPERWPARSPLRAAASLFGAGVAVGGAIAAFSAARRRRDGGQCSGGQTARSHRLRRRRSAPR